VLITFKEEPIRPLRIKELPALTKSLERLEEYRAKTDKAYFSIQTDYHIANEQGSERTERVYFSIQTDYHIANERSIERTDTICFSIQTDYHSPNERGIERTDRVYFSIQTDCQITNQQDFERTHITMGATAKEKGKSPMTRSVENIVFCTEMAALDFEPSREEETFLQLIGLDRFITRVTWEILNVQVIQEVIANLDTDTMETKLNGRVIPIFGKGWRQKGWNVELMPMHAA
jgi:hypothetical protein